jgi:hypothetical protein
MVEVLSKDAGLVVAFASGQNVDRAISVDRAALETGRLWRLRSWLADAIVEVVASPH